MNDNSFDQPQSRRSFVTKMGLKAKSKVYNIHPYNTISLLPKFLVSPNSGTWKMFDQESGDRKQQEQENGYDVIVEVPESGSASNGSSTPDSQTRRPSMSMKEKILLSRIISPINHHFQRHKMQRDKIKGINNLINTEINNSDTDLQSIYFDKEKSDTFIGEKAQSAPRSTTEKLPWGDKSREDKFVAGYWDEYKSKMAKVWLIFTGETTAHGYKRTTAPHRSKLGRMLWVLAIIGVTAVVMASLYNTVVQQDLNAFSSSFKSQPHISMPFPAVTVCNLSPYDFSRVETTMLKNHSSLIRQFLFEVSSLQDVVKMPNDSDTMNWLQTFDTRDLQDMIGWKLQTFIKKCYWNEVQMPCSEIFIQSLTVTESCFTFNFDPNNLKMADRVGSFSGLSLLLNVGSDMEGVTMDVANGLKVLLHEPTEFPNTRENGLLVSPGTTTYINVAKNEYNFLPRPYKAYGTEYCSDDENGGQNHKRHYKYTGYNSCVAECRLRVVLDKCGCVVYGRDPDIEGVPYCTMDKYINCYIPTLRETYMQPPLQIENCACPLPCKKIQFLSQVSSAAFPRTVDGAMFLNLNSYSTDSKEMETDASRRNYVELKIFYRELFTHIEEHVPLYNWLTIFGNVGGQMGLFTGASVLTILEFLELSLVMVWVVFQISYGYFRSKWRSGSLTPNDKCTP